MSECQGLLLVNKPKGQTSFRLVAALRRILGVKKIGHAGTLDPMATGVMVMLVGSKFTKASDSFLNDDKEYLAEVTLGATSDTYDAEGQMQIQSDVVPSKEALDNALNKFQGEIMQVPPMYSAKKVGGRKLYELARQGKHIERSAVKIKLQTKLIAYDYPKVTLHVECSKGTYIRSLANDLGEILGCGAHLSALTRLRSGRFHLKDCLDGKLLDLSTAEVKPTIQNALKDAL